MSYALTYSFVGGGGEGEREKGDTEGAKMKKIKCENINSYFVKPCE